MRMAFTKMHGLGNDFIVVQSATLAARLTPEGWRRLADRHRGIGFDQALVIEPARGGDTDAYYRIFNADGQEVEQCGNGARCIAAYLHGHSSHHPAQLRMACPGGTVAARITGPGRVAVDMGIPDFTPSASHFEAAGQQGPTYEIDVEGTTARFDVVSMGNPHAVLRVPDVATADVARLGPALESHPRFARRVNVGFLEVVDRRQVRLRVHERGAGETQACGTGACAAVAVGRRAGWLDAQVQVDLPGGRLDIRWEGPGASLWMEGPAEVAFEGWVEIDGEE